MKKLKLIYNPMAGNKEFPKKLDQCIEKLQTANYQVSIFRSAKPGDLKMGLKDVTSEYDAVVVAGGDGSINEIINALLEEELNIPLGIIPAGTANDFARQLNIPQQIESAVDVILDNKIQRVDIGQVNGQYFVNVCAAGLLANVSHQIDINLKNTLGKLGYYIKGIEQLPKFKNIPLKIETSQKVIEEEFYLFLILNGKSAGGFEQLAPQAQVDDGVFDFLGIKACPLPQIATLFVKMLQGKHLDDQNLIHLRDDSFQIETTDDKLDDYHSDLDGEKGPAFPLDISLIPKHLKVFVGT
ncbi:YegS/Rv2252/BmrU family lipid kinase [Halanaerobacter jeridensis]|uniref:YegS/Rv2252/BmrU family lipid kinase n=1 Tax=Halanaerobacter jeridensis TaxID=706427 RepID=A0A938XN72_9FIRM|nr:YegS/Rv2252/BmrU family lipid kinase [Halanaerobacter jeridensis]MBM7555433.1 YegS/Rv2252/BmrU family lipid kinase [Halanaerobacter jeridensis]